MAFNLKAMTAKELTKLKKDVEKALKSAEERARRDALKAVEKAAAEFGFSFDELSGKAKPKVARKGTKKKSKAKAKAAPKYRNPADPEQTWSGRGRQPFWFKEAVTGGTDPSSLEI
jgi:DNA-binding protein H-NS